MQFASQGGKPATQQTGMGEDAPEYLRLLESKVPHAVAQSSNLCRFRYHLAPLEPWFLEQGPRAS